MDKTLQTYGRLIRLARSKIDQKKIFLAQIESRMARLDHDIKMMAAHLRAEKETAENCFEVGQSFSLYAAKINSVQEKLNRQKREASLQLENEQDKMLDLFRELKTYEIAKSNHQHKLAREENRQNQSALDEIGLQLPERGSDPHGFKF